MSNQPPVHAPHAPHPSGLTHLNARGEAAMVDIAAKTPGVRVARARGLLRMSAQTLRAILDGGVAKGDVLAVARVAGIQAAKRTSDLIPLCHPLALAHVAVDFSAAQSDAPDTGDGLLAIEALCKVRGSTGVEMEALAAVSVAALTVYDMCKARDRGMTIERIGLEEKTGGASGNWRRGGA